MSSTSVKTFASTTGAPLSGTAFAAGHRQNLPGTGPVRLWPRRSWPLASPRPTTRLSYRLQWAAARPVRGLTPVECNGVRVEPRRFYHRSHLRAWASQMALRQHHQHGGRWLAAAVRGTNLAALKPSVVEATGARCALTTGALDARAPSRR